MSLPQPGRTGHRVLHLVVPGAAGGLETVVQLLTRAQRVLGDEPVVGAVLDSDPDRHPFVAGLRADGVRVIPLLVRHRAYLSELRQQCRLCRDEAPTVVHTHGARADVIGGLAARLARRTWVSTAHGFTGGDAKNRLYERLQVLAWRRADAVAAVSEPLRRHLAGLGVPLPRLHLVRNAWSSSVPLETREVARERLGLPRDRPVLGWVGRLSREKGLDVLLEALPRMAENGSLIAVVGDGGERPVLEARAVALGVADRLVWCGTVTGAAALYPAFDVLVLSSRTEGTPMVLFEAMAAGVPIVAANVGGVPDVIDEESGWLVPAEDPEALAGAVSAVLSRPDQARDRAARAARRLAEEYQAGAWAGRYDEFYRVAAASRGGR